jgi:brefeldin A-inhibited guanine nucleotide-exchange protein
MKQPAGVLNSKFSNKEDLSVWLSTTLIQALRQFVDLFTFYHSALGFLIGNMFALLKICIIHENEALSRIGSTCIQQLIEKNASNFEMKSWEQVSQIFKELFDETAPTFLFFNYKGDQNETYSDSKTVCDFSFLNKPLGPPPDRKEFQKQISKCVLHLLVAQTLHDVLATGPNDIVYKSLPNEQLLCLLSCFQSSYHMARGFNECLELRQCLFKMGYMKQLPNLLKQETQCANSYLSFLLKIYTDETKRELETSTEEKIIP